MYPDAFEYRRPETVAEAVATLGDNPSAIVLAGGHSLIPSMKTGVAPSMHTGLDPSKKTGLSSPEMLVDISRLDDLRGITHEDDAVSIGALTTYATLTAADSLWERSTVVAEAAGQVGDVQIRNCGTIGGNVAHADPASDLPGAVLAADATLVVHGQSGTREIAADEFFRGEYETAVGDDELIGHLRVPSHRDTDASAYVRRTSPSSGYAVVGVAVVLTTDGRTVESARVAANGAVDRAVRLSATEDALAGVSLDAPDALEAAAACAADDIDERALLTDRNASRDFRATLLERYTERALSTAVERV